MKEDPMSIPWRKIIAAVLALAVPAAATAGPASASVASAKAGPIKAALEKSRAGIAAQQPEVGRSRGRFWTSVALIAGGGLLGTLSVVELGDDEIGPDDGEDFNGSDDGEDSDGWGNKAMLGGGIAAAALGSVLWVRGGKKAGPEVALKRGGFAIRQTVRF
jgi:hypothetical protein